MSERRFHMASEEEIKKVEAEMAKVRDVCTRLEFRKLGIIAAGYAYYSIEKWMENKTKLAWMIETKNGIQTTELMR